MSPDSLFLRLNIAKIENKYPDDGIISSYKDYLKQREFLNYYQFNPNVFFSLLRIAVEDWKNGMRINKQAVVLSLYNYLELCKNKIDLPDRTASLLFDLLKLVLESSIKSKKTRYKLITKIAHSLIGLHLNSEEINYLLGYVNVSKTILILILRYKYKSGEITAWAKENFHKGQYREYRTELISWILDEDPGYEIDKQVLIDDFEYANERDRKAIQDYKDEISAIKILGKTLNKVFPKPEFDLFFDDFGPYTRYNPEIPELILTKRNYSVPTNRDEELELKPYRYVYDYKNKVYQAQRVHIPNFKSLESNFQYDLDEFYAKTMIYAIMFSRWGMKEKISLLEKYYIKDRFYLFKYIAVQNKSIEMLRWLIERE
ncbi:MAG: hypothetical protein PHN88_04670 [Ignavibacteria bacterium]|nr:hypothetical protein [Ignavibacteria bacterium]